MHKRCRITIRDIAVLGMMLAMLEAVKRALEFLPNIELVTLLFILFTLFYGAKTLLAAFAFTGVECLVFGAGLWNFMYLYIWPLEVLLVLLIRRKAGWEEGFTYLRAGRPARSAGGFPVFRLTFFMEPEILLSP